MRNNISKVLLIVLISIFSSCATVETNIPLCHYPKVWREWNINTAENTRPRGCGQEIAYPVDLNTGIVKACCYAN